MVVLATAAAAAVAEEEVILFMGTARFPGRVATGHKSTYSHLCGNMWDYGYCVPFVGGGRPGAPYCFEIRPCHLICEGFFPLRSLIRVQNLPYHSHSS